MMDRFINIPIDATGLIQDQQIAQAVGDAMNQPYRFTDVFIYSHGWWTNANDAMGQYSKSLIEFGKADALLPAGVVTKPPLRSFGIGIHWPSTLSEDAKALPQLFQPLSFYQMEKRGDTVGYNALYALMQLLYQARFTIAPPDPFRLTLLGHSFGCRVICRALHRLYDELNSPDSRPEYRDFVLGLPINLVLLQAAFENVDLEDNQRYANLQHYPNLRILTTHSDEDLALKNLFPIVEKINLLSQEPGSRQALGFAGPSEASERAYQPAWISIDKNYLATAGGALPPLPAGSKMLVVNLTTLHENDDYQVDNLSGHHSDVFRPEIYRLIAQFAFN
jgi:hypothetical protein